MTEARDFSLLDPNSSNRPKRISFEVNHTSGSDEAVEDPAENDVPDRVEQFSMRPRAMSHHLQSTKIPSRTWLTIQANLWRAGMRLGMKFHNYPHPKPPKPSFIHKIQTDTIPIELLFYVPTTYHSMCQSKPDHRYPVVVNFHGGGFCLGDATDDRYYARVILQYTSAVFVSVNYRRAPEHPYPIPVDDSVEALLYLATHADKYHIDPSKFALTGFSAGANLSLTIPFRLTFHTDQKNPRKFSSPESVAPSEASTPVISRTNSHETPHDSPIPQIMTTCASNELPEHQEPTELNYSRENLGNPTDSSAHLLAKTHTNTSKPFLRQAVSNAAMSTDFARAETNSLQRTNTNSSSLDVPQKPRMPLSRPQIMQQQSSSRITRLLTPNTNPRTSTTHHTFHDSNSNNTSPIDEEPLSHEVSPQSGYSALKILTIVSWYPLLDWTMSRSSKRRSSVMPNKTLNPVFTNLFDYSYLPPPDNEGLHVSPYASPGLAPDAMLRDGLPQRIQLWLCEYDMLLQEGKRFSQRLERLGKDISTTLIEGVPHGWDKSPNPFRDQAKIDKLYIDAAERLEATFEEARRKPKSVAGERIGLGGMR